LVEEAVQDGCGQHLVTEDVASLAVVLVEVRMIEPRSLD
jgi:hypothetical protein